MTARTWPSGGTWRVEAVAWLLALLGAATLLAALDYRTRDPDSVLYAQISAEQAARPTDTWVAPMWPSGAYMRGLFREHPAGLFALAGLLSRAGYPAEQAAYVVNLVCQVLTLVLVPRLCSGLAEPAATRALGLVLQLLPLAFVYRVRANHEPVLLVLFVIALLGVERSRHDARFGLLTVVGLVGLLLVKGLLVGPALLACVLWAGLRPAPEGLVRPWLGIGAALALLALTTWKYELAYVEATGESFLASYAGRWVGDGSVGGVREWSYFYVLFWYSARVVWFAFPWSLTALAGLAGVFRRSRWALFPLLVTLVYLLPLSLSDRRAERYAYPVYFVVATAGWLEAVRWSPRLQRLSVWLDSFRPLAAVLLWLLLLGLHLLGGGLPRIKLWAPDS